MIDFAKRPEKRFGLAIGFILLFSFFISIYSAAIKYISVEVPVTSIIVWNYIVGGGFLLIWMFLLFPKKKGLSYLKTKEIKNQSVRSLSRLASLFFFFYTLKHLAVADATLLLFTSSIFLPIIAYFWHRIGLHLQMWWGILIAFIGIGFILSPGKEIFRLDALVGVLSGITTAIAFLALRFAHYNEPSDRTLFYNYAIAGAGMLLFSLFAFESVWAPLTLNQMGWLFLIGLLGFISQIFVTLASRHAPMRFLSPFMYLSAIFGMILDWTIWKTVPSFSIYLGCFLIVLGNILMLVLYPKDDLQIRR